MRKRQRLSLSRSEATGGGSGRGRERRRHDAHGGDAAAADAADPARRFAGRLRADACAARRFRASLGRHDDDLGGGARPDPPQSRAGSAGVAAISELARQCAARRSRPLLCEQAADHARALPAARGDGGAHAHRRADGADDGVGYRSRFGAAARRDRLDRARAQLPAARGTELRDRDPDRPALRSSPHLCAPPTPGSSPA